MANQGGFDFSDTNASANAKIKPPSEQFNSADGQLKEARDPHDAGSVSESVTNKFRAEAGLTSFDSGRSSSSDFREFRESIAPAAVSAPLRRNRLPFRLPKALSAVLNTPEKTPAEEIRECSPANQVSAFE
ncbi:MAG: hypothetical protein R3F51_08665 [Cyanobacteriota/Melainabacteria group bacterium]